MTQLLERRERVTAEEAYIYSEDAPIYYIMRLNEIIQIRLEIWLGKPWMESLNCDAF